MIELFTVFTNGCSIIGGDGRRHTDWLQRCFVAAIVRRK